MSSATPPVSRSKQHVERTMNFRTARAFAPVLALALIAGCGAMDPATRDAQGYTQRGYTSLQQGGYREAIADFNRALESNPRYAEAYHGRGLVYGNLGRLDEAIADATRALEVNPKLEVPYTTRGAAYLDKGRPAEAMADFNRAL